MNGYEAFAITNAMISSTAANTDAHHCRYAVRVKKIADANK